LPGTGENQQNSGHATGGGAATQTGTDYQNRIAAWAAVSILAELSATLPCDLPANIAFEYLRCETEQPVDDIMVGTSDIGVIFIQAKHTINLQKGHDSELASTIKQFVRQFIVCKNASGRRPWERPLNQAVDRLIMATGTGSSIPIRENLKSVLNRVRTLVPGQSIADAAINQPEQETLSVILDHISYAWLNEYGVQPSDDEIRCLLSLTWVITLDVDPEGSEETEAKNLLRSTILRNPAETDAAWSVLVQECAKFARSRSGGDRSSLQKVLLNAGIDLKAPLSYSNDIQRLRQYSAATVEQLADLSTNYVDKIEVKIRRKSTSALRSVVEKESIVIVGEPGAGKSGALHDLVKELQSDQFDVVFIAVDRIEAQSLGTLRNEIGVSHEFIDVLKNWPGLKPAFLVIDALDAARSEPAIQTFRSLISAIIRLNSRWRIVTSIRKFDLRYNKQLQELFSGPPPTEFRDREFNKVCHINIPRLDDEELKQVESQSSDLANLVLNASSDLSELLRNPFNLRLMGELLGLKVPVEELSPISKQNELLDRYWTERVIREDAFSDAREAVLRNISKAMVEKRSLKVNRLEVVDPSTSTVLKDLLSSQVIAEWQATTEAMPKRYILTFSHNVIYDYAVSRLLLRVTTKDFIAILVGDPELLLAIRPSIVFHFKYIWSEDSTRQVFWNLVDEVLRCKDIPEIGKLIGPSVASEFATKINDFEPLFNRLENADALTKQIAEKACRHVIGALLSLPESSYDSLVGHGAGPWAQFLLRLSETIMHSTAYIIRPLLITLCERPQQFTQEQEHCIGKVARRLLTFARRNSTRDCWLINHAIQAVCRSFKSDAKESNELIRQSLELEHMKLYAAEEMPWLAREVKNLIGVDADLVEDIYKAAFTFNEKSEAKTQIGGSQILAMTSTRKQDYGMVRYELAKNFSEFLKIAPINATRALITTINCYVNEKHSPMKEVVDESFEFNGLQVQIRMDQSTIWDDGNTYRYDEPLGMLDIFEKYLIDTTIVEDLTACRREIIKIIALENKLSVLWKRLLQCGIKAPNMMGLEIKSLAWAKPILLCFDTEVAVGNFIGAIFEFLTEQERELIENTILSLTDDPIPYDQIKFRETDRNRLLGCLPDQYIVTERARHILQELRVAEALPPNEPHFRITTGWSGKPYGEEEYLAGKGVPVEEEVNKLIRSIEQPIKDFSKEYLNSSPTTEVIQSIFPAIRRLHEALSSADKDGVHPMQKDYAWGTLAEACERITSSNELSSTTEIESFFKAVLLEAARYPDPVPRPEYDSQFDEHPSWGKPAPRIDAAKGLTLLAYSPSCTDDTLLEAIISLVNDEVPAVRFQVVTNLSALYKNALEVMWQIIENVCEKEQSKGVLQGLLTGTFYRIAGANADRISLLTKMVFDKVDKGPGANSVRQTCVSIFSGLYLWQDIKTCRDVVNEMADNPKNFLEEVRYLVVETRELLTHGPVDPCDKEQDAVRKRAFVICERILNSVLTEIKAIDDSKFKAGIQLSPDEAEEFKGLAQIIDTIGTEIYFASGAFDEASGQQQDKKILTADEKKRFLYEADNLLNCLSDFGMFPSLTHHLLETLEAYIPLDPTNIFGKVGRIVTMAQSGGYQYESLAADLIVKIIERYLAEYSWVFREQEQCQRTLLEILDIFVNVGWPNARRLTYRLEEIYR
jgi:DNA replication protein DnaC